MHKVIFISEWSIRNDNSFVIKICNIDHAIQNQGGITIPWNNRKIGMIKLFHIRKLFNWLILKNLRRIELSNRIEWTINTKLTLKNVWKQNADPYFPFFKPTSWYLSGPDLFQIQKIYFSALIFNAKKSRQYFPLTSLYFIEKNEILFWSPQFFSASHPNDF